MAEKIIEIGYDDVLVIDKLFGPTVFANLKIVPDLARGSWIIYREWVRTGEYVEWCTIPAQVEPEFTDWEKSDPGGLDEGDRERLAQLVADRDRMVSMRETHDALTTARQIAEIAAARREDVDWPEIATNCGVDIVLLAHRLKMTPEQLDAYIDDLRAQADQGESNTKSIISAINDLGDAVVTVLKGGEPDAGETAAARAATPECRCECHWQDQTVMHAFPCCDRCGDTYLDASGKPLSPQA
jgi:hypothetical protein